MEDDAPLPELDEVRHWPVSFARGQVIYEEGDPATAMYRVDEGCVRLQINGADGHRQIVAFVLPGDYFGCSVDERISAAEAVTDVTLTRYGLQSVLELSTRSADLAIKLIRASNRQYRDLAHHVAHVAHLPAMERVQWFFTWLWRHEGGRPGVAAPLPMSRRDIGDFLGLAPETLSRALRDLADAGVLQINGRRSFVLRHTLFDLKLTSAGKEPPPASEPPDFSADA